jgi:DNA mismatch repair protein MutL
MYLPLRLDRREAQESESPIVLRTFHLSPFTPRPPVVQPPILRYPGKMGRIALLPDEVASQVAAGEVVERPASVVKELVENSLDAGATRIEIAIARGGSSLVRVVDNGIGMDRDDALLSLERHATSKIRTGNDLANIHTLGFRGEALPSIASVSRFRLATRPGDAVEGTEILVNGGKIETVRACGEAPGTLVEAKHLFYNLPARRKFLRTENTETSHVQHQLILQALGHPEVGFVLLRDQAVIFQLPPTRSLATRISDLRGDEIMKQLVEIEPTAVDGISIRGFLGKAGVSRPTRAEQIIFVNGRAVENLTIQHALREGYHTALMKGQYALVFLFLDLDPADVDVNVHPAKREVRFRNPDFIRQALAETVRKTLDSDRGNWSRAFIGPRSSPGPNATDFAPSSLASPVSAEPEAPLVPLVEQFALRKDWHEFPQPQQERDGLASPEINPSEMAAPVAPGTQTDALATSFPQNGQGTAPSEFRLLGVLGKLYILMENEEGLVLVDQHAAHERILFERLRRETETAGVPCQRLLIPIVLRLPPKDHDWLLLNAPSLQKMGFSVEPFGESTLKIDGIPQFLRMEDPANTIRQLVDELRSLTSSTSRLRLGEDVIAKTVCRYAVKANDQLHSAEIGQLVKDLLACELPYCCPHGRPTMIQIGYLELEKKFGRKV